MFPKVVTTYTRYERSDSPEFNINKAQTLPYSLRYHSNKQDKAFLNADNLKMQMMEERIKQLERQKYDQNEQINALMSHQMNQNRLHKSNSTNIMPLNQQPNPQSPIPNPQSPIYLIKRNFYYKLIKLKIKI